MANEKAMDILTSAAEDAVASQDLILMFASEMRSRIIEGGHSYVVLKLRADRALEVADALETGRLVLMEKEG